ncbi:P1 family peptidase [Aeromicrobium sp. CF4.19]|uniref:P1 family peptidase n=1 Tax=Aeromicrobium sp. CF4.19 TaxID=3373082 RepID=UPI003EE81312
MVDFAIPGVRVGHWTDSVAETGCTVIDLPEGTVASYEARGGAPASRELDLLEPDKTVDQVDAVVLTGGSAFGLAAADGVMGVYEERGRGVVTPAGRVPIIPTLALFDLAVGDASIRPDREAGRAAAKATSGEQVLSGRVGAGAGAHVGQWRGPDGRRPGGLAYAERRLGDVVVACVCAVNAFGDVDHGGDVDLSAVAALQEASLEHPESRSHTTIGLVVTNALLDKTGCRIVAQGAHDGLARAITPPHTRFDGDAFIAAATGTVTTSIDVVRMLALAATADAIRSVVGRGRTAEVR